MPRAPKIFVHGVPDSLAVWRPLLRELALDPERTRVPHLPGFAAPPPAGFACTKDAYAEWLLGEVEALAALHGPVDVVAHDWGALLAARVLCLRPDLVRTWTLSGAVIDPDYRGHWMARAWNTPLIGEAVMAVTTAFGLQRALQQGGVPREVAVEEAAQWRAGFAAPCILRLYRSADGLRFDGAWVDDLVALPGRGLLVWGSRDPYCGVEVARRFAARRSVALQVLDGAGHWVVAERPQQVARLLREHWGEA